MDRRRQHGENTQHAGRVALRDAGLIGGVQQHSLSLDQYVMRTGDQGAVADIATGCHTGVVGVHRRGVGRCKG